MTDIKSYSIVTSAYWGFTITDGALRMLVLLNFYAMGYGALDLAFLFLLYEAMGILTNFYGGWIGSRFGLRSTLFSGLSIQVMALILLAYLPSGLPAVSSVIYIMVAQALSGIAKDLTKMSSKSAVKLVASDQGGMLFKWVSLLTGSKNALKGVGFFVGGFLLQTVGFFEGLMYLAGGLFAILLIAVIFLKDELGKAKEKILRRDLFFKSKDINYLSAARIFLFASRDIWFVVALPVFLSNFAGWNFEGIGAFMAVWIIGYGIVQASVPKFLKNTKDRKSAAVAAKVWGALLVFVPVLIVFAMDDLYLMLVGLVVFGVIFAFNSSLHSYLIVALSDSDKVSLNVGFYYMANAVGRFFGTLLSGLIYQYSGMVACLIVSSIMILLSVLLVRKVN
ncbi:MAG: organoarsenical effux MFS transporter ArsJ [Kordiimonadaceae bacterium]|jgi:predicted MFS family arabinose efflux permease|nr:organoarsenical effux MFS transporter ArsJ [Kordiimonadaceae bacterium]